MSDLPDYTRAIILKGVDPEGNLVKVELDKDGHLSCSLRAKSGQEYKELVSDENGNLMLNFAGQSLSHMTSRSINGACFLYEGIETGSANAITPLLTVNGKGYVYGGLIYSDPNTLLDTDNLILTIDEEIVFDLTWKHCNDYNITKPGMCAAWLSCYDVQTKRYCLNVNEGITFDSSFKLEYKEVHGNTPQISYYITLGLM